MNEFLHVPAFVLGCAMLVLGAAGMSHVGRSRARRRHMIVFTLEELLGSDMRAVRRREVRVEVASKAMVVIGGVLAVAAYLSW